MKRTINNTFYDGERPLFSTNNLRLENVKFYPGESALKECSNIEAYKCEFMCKYPFWHNNNTLIEESLFTVYSRAAIWYSQNIRMLNSRVEAPKCFVIDGLYLENVKLTSAAETLWNCRDIKLRHVEAHGGDYIFMNGVEINIDVFTCKGITLFRMLKM